MFRKHTRRAAKAAFAVSFGVALLIGIVVTGSAGAAKSQSTTKKSTVVIGTKNFAEEYILGQLYGQALAAKGFHVVVAPLVAQAGLGYRIELRKQDVAEVDDVDRYDCVWVPTFFLTEDMFGGLPIDMAGAELSALVASRSPSRTCTTCRKSTCCSPPSPAAR